MKLNLAYKQNFSLPTSLKTVFQEVNGSLQHLMVRFLEGVPSSEVYRDAIEHEVGRELTSAARECSGRTSVQSALSVGLEDCKRISGRQNPRESRGNCRLSTVKKCV
jgi:hypothetical protein